MRRFLSSLLLAIFIWSCNNESLSNDQLACDNGTFIGKVILESQVVVNDFGANCYSKIDGNLSIGLIGGNNDITDLTPLSSITEIFTSNPDEGVGLLRISANNLERLNGLENVASVNALLITYCNQLTDLEGLNSLVSIGGDDSWFQTLDIHSNENLVSLNGLNNLTTIGQESFITFIRIAGNPELQNLDPLSNLEIILGEFHFETTIYVHCGPTCDGIRGNVSLSDFCGIQNLFNNGTFDEDFITIMLNAYNPTPQDIINGICSL